MAKKDLPMSEINYPAIQEIFLKAENPFKNAIVENPHQEIIDVEAINAELTAVILKALERIRKKEKRTDLILIQGEPGLGKTHFLSRMRKKARLHNYLFVDIPPVGDISRIYAHIFQQLFINLNRKSAQARYSPLFELIAHILSEIIIEIFSVNKKAMKEQTQYTILKLQEDPTLVFTYLKALAQRKEVRNQILERAIIILMDRHPEIDQLFLEVLFKLTDPDLEFLALKWLKGYELSEEDLARLNIREFISDDEMANRALNSILMIIDRPILFCLDQLESFSIRFETENGIKILFDTLTNMYNRYQNICMLLMCQSHVWTEIEKVVEKSALDRIQIKKSLAKLSFEESILLSESRLKLIYPSTSIIPYSTYPFSHDFIRQALKETGYNPRTLLNRLSREFDFLQTKKVITELCPSEEIRREEATPEKKGMAEIKPKEEMLSEFLDREIQKLRKVIKTEQLELYTYPVRQDFTRGILNELFKELKLQKIPLRGFQISEIHINQKTSKKDIDITLIVNKDNKSHKIGIEVNNSENMTSFSRALKHLLEDIQRLKLERVFLLRDKALTISSTAKKANENLLELKKSGGLLQLSEEDTVELMSLKKLLEKAGSGDLMYGDSLVTRNDVVGYILHEKFQIISTVTRLFELLETPEPPSAQKSMQPSGPVPSAPENSKTEEAPLSSPTSLEPKQLLPQKPPVSKIQKGKFADDLEELFSDISQQFSPSTSPPTPPKSESGEIPAAIRETNLKGNILGIIRRQPFFTLKKLAETFPNSETIQIRETLYLMAKEQMITIIYDRGEDFLFGINPNFK